MSSESSEFGALIERTVNEESEREKFISGTEAKLRISLRLKSDDAEIQS